MTEDFVERETEGVLYPEGLQELVAGDVELVVLSPGRLPSL